MQSFIWPGQNFEGETEGRLGLMGRLGGPRGWVREGDVPAWNAESLNIHYLHIRAL